MEKLLAGLTTIQLFSIFKNAAPIVETKIEDKLGSNAFDSNEAPHICCATHQFLFVCSEEDWSSGETSCGQKLKTTAAKILKFIGSHVIEADGKKGNLRLL